MANLDYTATSTSLTITCSGLDPDYSNIRYFYWQLSQGSETIDEKGTQMQPGGTSHSVTFDGLDPSTTYGIKCGIYSDSSYSEQLDYLTKWDLKTSDPPVIYCTTYLYRNNEYQTSDYIPLHQNQEYNYLLLNGEEPIYYPYNNSVLVKVSSNVSGSLQEVSSSSTFTCPSSTFSISFYYVDLELEVTETTESSITVEISAPTSIPDANKYTWQCGDKTQTTGSFTDLDKNKPYKISLDIYNKYNTENYKIGHSEIEAATGAGSNIWIYTGVSTNNGWQLATPYIYTGKGNTGWEPASAFMYLDGWTPV